MTDKQQRDRLNAVLHILCASVVRELEGVELPNVARKFVTAIHLTLKEIKTLSKPKEPQE